jgi:hypothetical protein
MDARYLIIGVGSVVVGMVDVALWQGVNQILGWLLLVVGIVVCVKGFLTDPEDPMQESIPDPLPGRLCDHCGKMTSLDSSTCEHCGSSLID